MDDGNRKEKRVILGRRLATCVLAALPLVAGTLSARLGMTEDDKEFSRKQAAEVEFSPPPLVFSIVWPVLFVLMGTSFAMITWNLSSSSPDLWRFLVAVTLLLINIGLNVAFPLLQFGSRDPLAGTIVTWATFFVAIFTLSIFFFYVASSDSVSNVIRNVASGIWIPYVLWLAFASVLSWTVYSRYMPRKGLRR